MNPSALHTLADQVGQVQNSLAEQVQTHEQISRNLNEGWRGTAADRAAGDVDDHVARMRSNAEGVAQLRTALSDAGNELTSARSNVLNTVAQLESNGFRVGQDWSVQDASGKKGMQRSYAQRDGVEQLRGALTGFNQAEQSHGQSIQSAQDSIKPVGVKAPMSFFSGGGGGGGGPLADYGVCVESVKAADLSELSDNQRKNFKTVYCATKKRGLKNGLSDRQIGIETMIAFMTVVVESGGTNLANPRFVESYKLADVCGPDSWAKEPPLPSAPENPYVHATSFAGGDSGSMPIYDDDGSPLFQGREQKLPSEWYGPDGKLPAAFNLPYGALVNHMSHTAAQSWWCTGHTGRTNSGTEETSMGIFQQKPNHSDYSPEEDSDAKSNNGGADWGSVAQCMDPTHATDKFIQHLEENADGRNADICDKPWERAQVVQNSGEGSGNKGLRNYGKPENMNKALSLFAAFQEEDKASNGSYCV